MVLFDVKDLIKQFIIGGVLVSTISFVGNNVSVQLAAIITALPIGLIPIYFFNQKKIAQNFGLDATFTNLIVFLTYLVYDNIIRRVNDPKEALFGSLIAWAIFSVILYVYWTYFSHM